MKKFLVAVCGVFIYAGEVLLIIIFLSAVNNFFDKGVTTFPPTSTNYLQIAFYYIILAIALAAAIFMLRREIMLGRKDWAKPEDFWFFKA